MAEIVAIFGTVLEAVTNKYVLNPIMNQFSYLCCYSGNVQTVRDQVEKLNKRWSELQPEVDEAKRNVQVIRSDVMEWIEEVGKLSEKKERIIQDEAQVQQGCFYGICPNIKLRYRLSRDARKTAEAAQGLLQEVNKFTKISYPPPLEPIPTASADIEVDSRKSKQDEIMMALKDENVYVIAFCGMGGVGKTTMARKIESKVREGKIFEEVVMIVVSRPLDLKNVQQGIAGRLGLRFEEHEDTQVRAQRLHMRLKETESVLIILDDVWEKFNLQEIGIPSKTTHRRCKIILTSRIQHVCRNIEYSAKIILLDALPEQEAWNLFKKKAGEIVVAAALRDSSIPSWKDALHQLKASQLATDIPEVHEEVYVPLKWSYDWLQNEEARYLFLLCCLFPEDYEIRLHLLVEYGFALGIFANIFNLEEARNRVYRLVEMLIDRFLLIRVELRCNDFNSDHCMKYRVKMHDVIRDMAISIASKDKYIFLVMHDRNLSGWPRKDCYENYTCISLSSRKNIALAEKIDCSKLELLRVNTSGLEIQERSFDGMSALKVLHTHVIKSLPSSLSWPRNLRALFLVNYQGTILPNYIGELVGLEILNLCGSSIETLPKELARLKSLRLLDLTDCRRLKNIPHGVISGLVQLEELYMTQFIQELQMTPFIKEFYMRQFKKELYTVEVASSTNLPSLQLGAYTYNLNWRQKSGNCLQLIRHRVVIGIGDGCITLGTYDLHHLTDLIQVLFNKAQSVILLGRYFSVEPAQRYKNPLVLKSEDIEFLFDSNYRNLPNISFLPCLTTLVLENNDGLKDICHGPLPTGFFSNLENLLVKNCGMLQEIIGKDDKEEETNSKITLFPQLKELVLFNLPKVQQFCYMSQGVELPSLEVLDIKYCYLIQTFSRMQFNPTSSQGSDPNFVVQSFFNEVTCSKLKRLRLTCINGPTELFNHKISIGNFSGLKTIYIGDCQRLRSIFSVGMFRGLVKLRELVAENCPELQEVISKDEEACETHTDKETLFPQLKSLYLIGLPKLIKFCHIKNDLELPSLQLLGVSDCRMFEVFSPGSVHLPRSVRLCGDKIGCSETNFESQFLCDL